jgi:hypothetical protein
MINLGTLFSKPGESHYSVHRRFLIANHTTSYKSIYLELDQHFIEVFGDKFINDVGRLSVVQLILMLEGKKFKREVNFNDTRKETHKNSTAPSRHCPKCASIGYHTNLFELKWVELCPIHNCLLVTFCPKCRKPWPTLHRLDANRCSCCGVTVKLTSILENFKENKDKYKQIQTYLQQLSKHRKLRKNYIFLHGNKITRTFSGVNKISAFSIEALRGFRQIDDYKYKQCMNLIDPKTKSTNEGYQCFELKDNELREYMADISTETSTIIPKISSSLWNELSIIKQRLTINLAILISSIKSNSIHPLGDECLNENCKVCSIWAEWMRLVCPNSSRGYDTKSPEYFNRYFKMPEIITHIISLKDKPLYRDIHARTDRANSCEIHRIKKFSKYRVFKISDSLTARLYEIELWISANIILHKISTNTTKLQLPLFEEIDVEFNSYHCKYDLQVMSIYLNIISSKNYIELSIPKNLLKSYFFKSFELAKLVRTSGPQESFYKRSKSNFYYPI